MTAQRVIYFVVRFACLANFVFVVVLYAIKKFGSNADFEYINNQLVEIDLDAPQQQQQHNSNYSLDLDSIINQVAKADALTQQHQQQHDSDSSADHDSDFEKDSNSVDDGGGSAFCLLIKDDNDILSEWVAYHYHVFQMRRLIVAVDPYSKTSPLGLLQPWGKNGFELNVTLWSDEDYMPAKFYERNANAKGKYNRYRRWQVTFISECYRRIYNETNNNNHNNGIL